MSNDLDQPIKDTSKKRPVFLTVLCILTFVSCGIGLFTSSINVVVDDPAEQVKFNQYRSAKGLGPSQGGFTYYMPNMESAKKMEQWSTSLELLSYGNVILCLGGALLMWWLRKIGFFIYLGGHLLSFVSLYITLFVLKDLPIFGMFMMIGAFFSVIFSIGFIVMYALNLKHMR